MMKTGSKKSKPKGRRDYQPLVEAASVPVEVIAPALSAAKREKAAADLAEELSQLSLSVGLRRLHIRADRLPLRQVRQVLQEIHEIAQLHLDRDPDFPTQTVDAKGQHWSWQRHRQVVRPVFVGVLLLAGETEAALTWFNGDLTIPLGALPLPNDRLMKILIPNLTRAGMCTNTLKWKPTKGEALRPIITDALDAEGAPIELDDEGKEQMANAFWQATWATGSSRQAHGKTFPLAMLPVSRSVDGPLDEATLETSTGIIYGQLSVASHVLQRLASAGKLLYDPDADKFLFTGEKGIGATENAALDLLNTKGYFEKAVATPPTRTLQVARVLPYQGAHRVSHLFNNWAKMRSQGLLTEETPPLAGINSHHFLNFPEEFQSPHSALNDPVSTLFIDGKWRCAPVLRRGSLLVSAAGKISIRVIGFEDVVIATPLLPKPIIPLGGPKATGIPASVDSPTCPQGGVQIFTPWSVAQSPDGILTLKSFQPGRDRAFVIVGTEIVEDLRTDQVLVPHSGWILVMHGAEAKDLPETLTPEMRRIELRWRRPTDRQMQHAMAVGPMLVTGGKPITGDHFDFANADKGGEQFACWEGKGSVTKQRGVAPTRFPTDALHTRAPRTAIGVRADGEVVTMVVDGRSDSRHSVGMTLCELALSMKNAGCKDALNLDGGGSSVMFLNHPSAREASLITNLPAGLVNRPSDRDGEERIFPTPLLLWAK